MTTTVRTALAQPDPEPRRLVVRRYYGDTLIDGAIITGARGPRHAARTHLTATTVNYMVMSDRRADDLTPGATRWTLTRYTGHIEGEPAGGITVVEARQPTTTGPQECSGCPSTARDTDACPNVGINAAGDWLCVDCCGEGEH
jgi:hypothetical protein